MITIKKSLDIPGSDSFKKVLMTCNSYRLYIYNQSTTLIDIFTLHFAHLHTKQLPYSVTNKYIDEFTCSDSFLVLHFKEIPNKIVILDPTTMVIQYDFDMSYRTISSIRCFDNGNVLVFIASRHNGDNRLVFFNFENKNEENEILQIILEKAIEYNDQFVYLLSNCRDLMILNATAGRVQYMKYRS